MILLLYIIMDYDNEQIDDYEKERQNILKNLKLNKKEDFVLIQIYLDLLKKYEKNKEDKQLYENIKLLEKYIFI